MIPSHSSVILSKPKKLEGQAGHVVTCDDSADPPSVTVKVDSTGEVVTVAADSLQVLG